MKHFVSNYISGEKSKFHLGEELYNLVTTYIACDQIKHEINREDLYLEC